MIRAVRLAIELYAPLRVSYPGCTYLSHPPMHTHARRQVIFEILSSDVAKWLVLFMIVLLQTGSIMYFVRSPPLNAWESI